MPIAQHLTLPQEYDSTKFKLQAVNILLACISEMPLTEVDDIERIAEAIIASSTLEEAKSAVLAEKWVFNSDVSYPMMPDTAGKIAIPANILDLHPSDGTDKIIRNWKLYDRANHTENFDAAVLCDVVWDTAFNELTHPLRYYITVKAARMYQGRMLGDKLKYAFEQEDETNAELAARRSETRTGSYNMLTSGTYGTDNKVR